MMIARTALLTVMAAIALPMPAGAQQILPPGQIDAAGNLKLGPVTLGKRQGSTLTITPDILQLKGSGSTGDVSGMSVTPSANATTSTLARLIADRAPLASPTFTGTLTAPGATLAGIPWVANNLGQGKPGQQNIATYNYFWPSVSNGQGYDYAQSIDYRPGYSSGNGNGGVPGTNVGLTVGVQPAAGNTDQTYAVLGKITASTENGPLSNYVSVFGNCIKTTRLTSPCWGAVTQSVEQNGTANPTTNTTGHEINVVANGTDDTNQRTLLSLSLQPYQPVSTSFPAPVAADGILVSPLNQDPTQGSFKNVFRFVGNANVAFNLSAATCTVACWQSPNAQILGTGRANFANVGIGTQSIFLFENSATTGQLGIRAGTSSNAIFANFDPTNGFAVQGPVQGTVGTFTYEKLIPTTFASLAACSSAGPGTGLSAVITDAAGTIAYRGAASGGGSQHAKVFCDAANSRWVYN